jgi:hypothetical protein
LYDVNRLSQKMESSSFAFLQKLTVSGMLQMMPREQAKELIKKSLVLPSEAENFLKWLASVDLFRSFPFPLFNCVAMIAEADSRLPPEQPEPEPEQPEPEQPEQPEPEP